MIKHWLGIRHYLAFVRARLWRVFFLLATLIAVICAAVVWRVVERQSHDDAVVSVDVESSWRLQPTTFAALGADWADYDEWQGAWRAFRLGCAAWRRFGVVKRPQAYRFLPESARQQSVWQGLCARAERMPEAEPSQIRAFFETYFMPYRFYRWQQGKVAAEMDGLFTGYFRPTLFGSRTQTERFHVPLYAVPSDLVVIDTTTFPSCQDVCPPALIGRLSAGRVTAYPTRADIMAGAIDDVAQVLAWADDPLDVFLLSVQGSGRLRLQDGSIMILRYAERNGHAYKSLGAMLKQRGVWQDERDINLPKIRRWLQQHEDERDALLAENPLYIFFQEVTEDKGAVGALGVPLVAGHALAIDTGFIPLGVPLWVETTHPLTGDTWHQLMLAQDRGSAIKGVVRGDIFWGDGTEAEISAGLMNDRGRYAILLPKALQEQNRP